MASEDPRLRGLYAVTPEGARTDSLVERTRLCLEGGARIVQYRAKSLAPALALEQARSLAHECRRADALFIVNDSVELALAAGADGVHLGREDGDPREARARMPRAVIGVSCYADPQRARDAAAAGASYVGIGSIFASSTKPHAAHAPLEIVARAKAAGGLPVAAIGGITPANAARVVDAGADMLAVISALYDAADVTAAARSLSRLFDAPRKSAEARAQPRAV
jgi:thiamine-phosphate pyrophosphorylase